MKVLTILCFYLLLGLGSCAALGFRRGRLRPIEGLLLLLFWPLYGPFALMEESGRKPPPSAAAQRDYEGFGPQEQMLLDALQRAANTPLAPLLPDVAAGRRLAQRMVDARRRVGEIDELLRKDEFSELAARQRYEELLERGDKRSATLVQSRLLIIERLHRMRGRYAQEMEEITELLKQLHIQAELVRIAGAADNDTRDLINELVGRIQGLEEVLDEEHTLVGA